VIYTKRKDAKKEKRKDGFVTGDIEIKAGCIEEVALLTAGGV
jgi:hypothetical protein